MDSTETLRTLRAIVNDGDEDAAARLTPVVYDELRKLADGLLRGERRGHTLQPTALVHEAYLRLIGQPLAPIDHAHFVAIAAREMRRVLIDHARARAADKRGKGWHRISLIAGVLTQEEGDADLLDLEDALAELEAIQPRQARMVELRFFGGLGVDEVATALGLSPRTVADDWRMARAWLHQRLAGHP
ncbi:MAG: ECF-type sigma factor [Planctomycetota bacterium]